MKQKPGMGFVKGYYMAQHLRFLDPYLKSRTYVDSNFSEEDEPSEILPQDSAENVDGNNAVQVTLEHLKVEREDDETECQDQIEFLDHNPLDAVELKKREHIDDEGSAISSYSVKKMRLQDRETKRDLNSNEMYLLSLAPYLEDMSERQKLKLQTGVLQLIEQIKYGSEWCSSSNLVLRQINS